MTASMFDCRSRRPHDRFDTRRPDVLQEPAVEDHRELASRAFIETGDTSLATMHHALVAESVAVAVAYHYTPAKGDPGLGAVPAKATWVGPGSGLSSQRWASLRHG